MNKIIKPYYFLAIALIACNDFIDIDAPKTQIVPSTVFETTASAESAIRGVYSLMMTNTSFTRGGLEEYTGIASDELTNYSTSANRLQFYQNSLTTINGDVQTVFWGEAYKYISNANAIIEGVEQSNIAQADKTKLTGEAKFIRAYCHFYLAMMFGDVPYLTTSNYEVNSKASQIPFDQVMTKLALDLSEAHDAMPDDFSAGLGERIRPNSFTAAALLARVYLYQKEWVKAEQTATLIINSGEFELSEDLSQVFLANSVETIWQLEPVSPNTGAPQASVFVLTAAPNGISRRVAITNSLYDAFEADDQRKEIWTKNYTNATGTWNFIYKYTTTNSPVEYSMVFRLAEQYLIRAEALAQQNKLEEAAADVNTIRLRAGLNAIESGTQTELLNSILQERRVELFGEGGHRWMDLKRFGKIDEVLSVSKPQWQSTDALFPIPNSERLLNSNLTQNLGY